MNQAMSSPGLEERCNNVTQAIRQLQDDGYPEDHEAIKVLRQHQDQLDREITMERQQSIKFETTDGGLF